MADADQYVDWAIKIDDETTGIAFIGWLDTWGSDEGNTDSMVDYANNLFDSARDCAQDSECVGAQP